MTSRILRATVFVCLALVAGAVSAHAQVSRSGPTFLIGGTTPVKEYADAAFDPINNRYLVVNGKSAIDGMLVAATGGVLKTFRVNLGLEYAQMPRVAYSPDIAGGGGFLVTWHASVGSFAVVMGRLIAADGTPLGADITISPAGSHWIMGADIAYSTTSHEFIVVWMGLYLAFPNTHDIFFNRLSTEGVLLQPLPTRLGPGTTDEEREPSVAYNPDQDEFYVVWGMYSNAGGFSIAEGQRIKAGTGQLLGPTTDLDRKGAIYIPSVTYNSATKEYLAGWTAAVGGGWATYGATIDGATGASKGVRVLSSYYAAYDALDIDYNVRSGDYALVTHGRGSQDYEDAVVGINPNGTPIDNGFIATNTPDVSPQKKGNYNPRITASTIEKKWLLVTSSAFSAVNGQFIQSSNSAGPIPGTNPDGPTLTLTPSSLNFGAVGTFVTPSQTLSLTQSKAGTVTWTVSANQPWITVSPTSGTGPAKLTITVNSTGLAAGAQGGSVAISALGSANNPSAGVTVKVMASATSAAPTGAFDTPTDNVTGVTGSIAVTGWALDDVGVKQVQIWRDPVAGEGSTQVFIGNAVIVEGSRPDIAALNPTAPANSSSGWGYLLLTNFLPNQGDGTYKLYAVADDLDGHSTTLGSRTITCTNSSATRPFGAIDTPLQGETISGSSYNNFGWVLSHSGSSADPPSGGTVSVLIDGVFGASPVGWTNRADLTQFFPAGTYPGVANALGVSTINTTTLANGLHTIAWIVTANNGETDGVGSRYFSVFNGTSLQAGLNAAARQPSGSLTIAAAPVVATPSAAQVSALALDRSPIASRRGFNLDTPFIWNDADGNGTITIQAEEVDRIELLLKPHTTGYLRVGSDLVGLPVGSHLDEANGVFTWQPGVGFIHAYDFVFVQWAGGQAIAREAVRIVLNQKRSGYVGPQVVIDIPSSQQDVGQPFTVAGWAIDPAAVAGTGVARLDVWAYPLTGGDPIFVGTTAYGGARPDVAALFGDRFRDSGYGLTVSGLTPGNYDLAVFAWSTAQNTFMPAKVVRVTVR
jgi:hypothetical protein